MWEGQWSQSHRHIEWVIYWMGLFVAESMFSYDYCETSDCYFLRLKRKCTSPDIKHFNVIYEYYNMIELWLKLK